MKLIDKDALVLEIEKYYNECLKRAKIADSDYWNAKADAYRNVLVILNDTLEVKEVDFEKEYKEVEKTIDSLQEEPVSKVYKNALNSEAMTFLEEQQIVLSNLYADIIMRAVKRGAQWQKQQMMNGAIKTTIKAGTESLGIFIKELDRNKYSFGDKVKVIIIKQEEE